MAILTKKSIISRKSNKWKTTGKHACSTCTAITQVLTRHCRTNVKSLKN